MTSQPFTTLESFAAPIMQDNIDTDQIIPSREMTSVSREGLGEGLFAGWRYKEPGGRDPDPDFILNRPAFSGAEIIISGENFGCGSSREHAVWALREYGIRAVIAKSFGSIFQANCSRNGILPVALPGVDVDRLAAVALQGESIGIDLPGQEVATDKFRMSFQIDGYAKRLLVEGLDPIGLTLSQAEEISSYLETDKDKRPWVYA